MNDRATALSRPAPRPSSRRHGFTLVELLVVIGIIAVLVSILLPSLGKARRSAVSLQCLSNLRQMGVSVQMYAQEYKGYMPQAKTFTDANQTAMWWSYLLPYQNPKLKEFVYSNGSARSASEFRSQNLAIFCPAWTLEGQEAARVAYALGNASENDQKTGYGINWLPFFPSSPWTAKFVETFRGMVPDNGAAHWTYATNETIRNGFPRGRYYKLTEIGKGIDGPVAPIPSDKKAVLADSWDYRVLVEYPWALTNTIKPNAGLDYWRHSAPSQFKTKEGLLNVLFADGHADSLRPMQAYRAFHDPRK